VQVRYALSPTPIANDYQPSPDTGAKRYPLELAQCNACGHVQLHHVAGDLFKKDYKYATPEIVRQHYRPAAVLLRQRYPKALTALEIGCNNGIFLDCLREQGFEATGIDPCAVSAGTHQALFTEDYSRRLGKFDLIVANNVFAHIDDISDVFRGIDHALSKQGAVVFEAQYFPALMASGAFDMIYHEHLDYHTLAPLPGFLARFGLVMTQVDHIPTHGGSIRVHCQRNGTQAVVEESNLGWVDFANRVSEVRYQVREMLNGEKVVAFGAAAKATTLIHHCGIAKNILYCVDDTPQKQGRYIPGTDIEIRPVETWNGEPLFLTAWNFETEIRRRMPKAEILNPFKPKVCA